MLLYTVVILCCIAPSGRAMLSVLHYCADGHAPVFMMMISSLLQAGQTESRRQRDNVTNGNAWYDYELDLNSEC